MAKKLGRPSIYSEELAKKICTRLANGESLRKICSDDGMPAKSVVIEWALDSKHPFADQYARARRIQAELMIDEVNEISDDGTNDYMLTKKGLVPDHEHMARSRLRVDTRKWIACKVLPKIYGDKIHAEHSGSISLNDLITDSFKPKTEE